MTNDNTKPVMDGVEPAANRVRYRSEPGMIGHYPWSYSDRRPRRVHPGYESQDLYTADQINARVAELQAEKDARIAELENALNQQADLYRQCLLKHDQLRRQLAEAQAEIATLRQYGNKDCTAMADEAIASQKEQKG